MVELIKLKRTAKAFYRWFIFLPLFGVGVAVLMIPTLVLMLIALVLFIGVMVLYDVVFLLHERAMGNYTLDELQGDIKAIKKNWRKLGD